MNKHAKSVLLIVALAVLVVVAALLIVGKQRVAAPIVMDPSGVPASEANEDISIANLAQGQAVALPYQVMGTVRGNWFFEGSFPVFVKDASGTQIGVGLASSTENWMTTNMIPFAVTLPDLDYSGPATVVFTKDNPSGEAQFDDSFAVSVMIQ